MECKLKLVITVDVEEEGLFSGRYPRLPPGVSSVRELRRVEFITREFGLPLTLLVTHPVAANPDCGHLLRMWNLELGAEIGTHLHPWNTPPFADLPFPEPVRSDLMASRLLEDKLNTLNRAIESHLEVRPRSFRMGRFDLGSKVRRLLPLCGLLVDSSVVPLRYTAKGPDHFMLSAEPFWWAEDSRPDTPLLEVPLTQVAIHPQLAAHCYRVGMRISEKGRAVLLSWFRNAGVLGVQPAWFPLPSLQWAVRLHHGRGGRVLTMFFHSTELLPGATPDFPTEASVCRLVRRMRAFLSWLTTRYTVEGVTLSGLINAATPGLHPSPQNQKPET